MEELLKAFNKERKANKNRWTTFRGELDGLPVAIKSYNTWIQILDHLSCHPVLTEISRHQPMFSGRRQNATPFWEAERVAAAFADVASE